MSVLKSLVLGLSLLFSSLAFAGVDINSADAEALAGVKGIGPAKAAAIVAYRADNGKFKSVDELVNVKGIGPKLLAKVRADLSVGK